MIDNSIYDNLLKKLPSLVCEFLDTSSAEISTKIGYGKDLAYILQNLEASGLLPSYEHMTKEMLLPLNEKELEEALKRTDKASASILRRRTYSLRSFFSYLFGLDNAAERIPLPTNNKAKEMVISDVEKERILEIMDTGEYKKGRIAQKSHQMSHLRDMSMYLLICDMGLKISEVASLNTDQVKDGFLYLEERQLPLTPKLLDVLSRYMETERRILSSSPGAMFISGRKTRISERRIEQIIREYAEIVTGKKVTAYDLRKMCGKKISEEKGKEAAMEALGGISVATYYRSYKH